MTPTLLALGGVRPPTRAAQGEPHASHRPRAGGGQSPVTRALVGRPGDALA